jgi:dihydrodipicolinate synthase/N-acetylneuraminate lyase
MLRTAFAASIILVTKLALLGYVAVTPITVSFTDPSQESFYSKLKKFADECNTNLYVSNIPKNMNEHVCCPLSVLEPHH